MQMLQCCKSGVMEGSFVQKWKKNCLFSLDIEFKMPNKFLVVITRCIFNPHLAQKTPLVRNGQAHWPPVQSPEEDCRSSNLVLIFFGPPAASGTLYPAFVLKGLSHKGECYYNNLVSGIFIYSMNSDCFRWMERPADGFPLQNGSNRLFLPLRFFCQWLAG